MGALWREGARRWWTGAQASRRPGGTLCGLEERVSIGADTAAKAGGHRADFAVWAHVPEAGDRADRGQLAASQRARGTRARHTPGSADQENAAEEHQQL